MGANFQKIFDNKVEISAEILPYVSYLHYHNQLPIIPAFSIRAIDGKSHSDIKIVVDLVSGTTKFAETLELDLGDIGPAVREELVSIKLLSELFAAIASNQLAELSFAVYQSDISLGSGSFSTELYPLNSWRRSEALRSDALLLASFSQPGDKSIPELVSKSRAIKHKMTDDSGRALSQNSVGYQAGPDSVIAETKALYEAIQQLNLEYSNPFPNFNLQGQPIRTVSQIIEDKSATCLDTAMMMSSCLTFVGLHPVVMVVPGHAFVGVWLTDHFLSNPVEDLIEIAGLIRGGRILIFETTTLCVRERTVSFEDAQVQVNEYLDPSFNPFHPKEYVQEKDIRLAIDIRRAQFDIKPLPSISISKNGEVTVVETVLPKVEFNFTGTTATPKVSLKDDNSPDRVKIWKSSLLDMTFNNPLLNRDRRGSARLAIPKGKLGEIEDFLQIPGNSLNLLPLHIDGNAIPLSVYNDLPEKINETLNKLLVADKALGVSGNEKQVAATLKRLISSSKASIQETGVNNLFMTFGSLTWDKDPESPAAGQVTSPLFLLPITIKHLGKNRFTFELDDTEDTTPNETLALALSKYGINIPLLSNPESDSSGIDIPKLLNQVREQVLVVNKKTNWIVSEDATIGTFDFSSFHMWKDLNNNWAELAKVPLVKHLIDTDGTKPFVEGDGKDVEFTSDQLDAEIEKLPIPSDETQVRAILKSLSNKSFVIQGPPGTGKSQTITNLLARNLQEGKKVLFMSEKPAALAVVKTRLDGIGLGKFVLDLHDKGTKPSAIRSQLLDALDAAPEADKTALDAATAAYDTALRTLATYPKKLHDVDPKHNESIYSARDRMLSIPGSQTLKLSRDIVNKLDNKSLREFIEKLRDLPEVGTSAGTFSTNRWSFSAAATITLSMDVKEKVKSEVTVLAKLLNQLAADSSSISLLGNLENISDFRNLVPFSLKDLPNPTDLALARSNEGGLVRHELKAALTKLMSASSKSTYYQEKLASLDLDLIQSALNEAESAKLFKGKKLEGVAQKLNLHLTTQVNKETVSVAIKQIRDLVEQARKVLELAGRTIGLKPIDEALVFSTSGLSDLEQQIARLESVIEATSETANKNAKLLLAVISSGDMSKFEALAGVSTLVVSIFEGLQATEESITSWKKEATFGKAILDCYQSWLDDSNNTDLRQLTRWALVVEMLNPLLEAGQRDAVQEVLSGTVPYDAVSNAFERGFLSHLFWKLLDDKDLHNFDGVGHDSKIVQLDKAISDLRKYNQALIASQVVAGRGFESTARVGVSGALRTELGKQKSQLPVRVLLQRFWETVTQVAPIVAASPDSVARFLDINTAKFDLVVFDEASQIRVATAIGALGRAKQAIIVGDSKQMPPTANFRKADGSGEVEFDEEDSYGLNDQESILSMATVSQIPDIMLSWHYRSQDEILIAFSNKEIYEGKLSSFPSPRMGEQPLSERKLRFEYEEGNYYVSSRKRKESDEEGEVEAGPSTNLAEAKRVVQEIQKYVKASKSGPVSVGVITMNEQQRNLIQKLLEATEDATLSRMMNHEIFPEDYIFVRALEKVQGDERDVILFSLGFAPESKGARLNLTFGPLTKGGSERRLNVAITRARKEMVVFASFRPEQMDLPETASRGMKLLKKFLEFASQGNIDLRTASNATAEDRHRSDIAKALSAAGLKVVERLGMSKFRVDLAIADPRDESKSILGILLDGRGWLDRKTSADREVLPSTVLVKNMKWPGIERIWLPMWLRDPAHEVERIVAAVNAAVAADELKTSIVEAPEEVESDDVIELDDLMSMVDEPKLEVAPQAKTSKAVGLGVNIDEIPHFTTLLDRVMVDDKKYIQFLNHPKVIELVVMLINELTKVEGPVASKRATSFVAKCFGLKSVQAARQEEILEAIPVSKFKRDPEDFIFPAGIDPKKFDTWAKQSDSSQRAISEISLAELANAMATICSKTAGMESAELCKQTALAFGTTRLTTAIEKRLFDAEQHGIKLGRLRQEGGVTFTK